MLSDLNSINSSGSSPLRHFKKSEPSQISGVGKNFVETFGVEKRHPIDEKSLEVGGKDFKNQGKFTSDFFSKPLGTNNQKLQDFHR